MSRYGGGGGVWYLPAWLLRLLDVLLCGGLLFLDPLVGDKGLGGDRGVLARDGGCGGGQHNLSKPVVNK